MDQSKTSYMHQTNQNKKYFDLYREKLSLTTVPMVTRENLFSLDTISKNCKKNIFLWLYPRTPNFTTIYQML